VIRKRYTAEFKAQAVSLVGLGKPVPEVAEELGISEGLLYKWVRKDAQTAPVGSEEPVADEVRRLRRELANLKLENDILKKAAVILGTKLPPGTGR
jgi:transposase